jgi:GxxExxY protein
MNTNEHESKLDALVETVIGAAYQVSNTLGSGYAEKVYEHCLAIELMYLGLKVKPQASYTISYRGRKVGTYFADLVVAGQVIVEIKCVDCFANQHIAQCLNYLKASNLKLALLINFQKPKVQRKRLIL